MIPVVTPEEMRAMDAAAPEPVEVLIERAGAALTRAAVRMLGGTYGRRVVVVAGKGNNGADGRAAARRLARQGVRVTVVDAAAAPAELPASDLVIDAAYGTGFRGEWNSPDPAGAPVLAADIPSGVDGSTGAAGAGVRPAARGDLRRGQARPAVPSGQRWRARSRWPTSGWTRHRRRPTSSSERTWCWLPARSPESHKWRAALWIVAGSSGMLGAAHLASRGAQRAGAGYVRLSSPGVTQDPMAPTEVVGRTLPSALWSSEVLGDLSRFHALVIGPGLGRADTTATSAREVIAHAPLPVVVDGDGLFALAWSSDGAGAVLRSRPAPRSSRPTTANTGCCAAPTRCRPDRGSATARC